jgi:hypothetical protein
VIEHVPAEMIKTVVAYTEQTPGVPEVNIIARPEVADALMVTDEVPKVRLAGCAKVIVCACAATVKLRVTLGAALYSALPSWLAVIEQVPPPTSVTSGPDTVQTLGVVEMKVTGSPELAEAVIVNGTAPKFWLTSGLNVMVCETWPTVIEMVLLVDAWLPALPLYCALRVWGPAPSAEVLKVYGLALWLAVPSGVDPS